MHQICGSAKNYWRKAFSDTMRKKCIMSDKRVLISWVYCKLWWFHITLGDPEYKMFWTLLKFSSCNTNIFFTIVKICLARVRIKMLPLILSDLNYDIRITTTWIKNVMLPIPRKEIAGFLVVERGRSTQ